LTATLAIAFVTLSVIALLVASGPELYFNFRTQQEVVTGEQRLIALEAANTVKSFMQERFGELEAAVKFSDLSNAPLAVLQESLEKSLGFQPAFRQLVLFDTEEQIIAQTSRLSQMASQVTSQLEADLFAQTGQGARYISPAYIDGTTFEPLVVIAVPVKNIFGDFQGTLVAEVNLKFMWDLVERLKVGETGVAYVVDGQGQLLAFGDITRVLAGENLSHLGEVAEFVEREEPLLELDEEGIPVSTGINGTNVVATYIPLGTPDWAVLIELPVAEAYGEVLWNFITSGMVIFTVAVLAAVTGAYLARRLAAPLLNLTETATRITAGDIDLQAAAEGPTEVSQLAGAFNSMTAQLRDLIGSLEDQVQERTAELTLSVEVGQQASAIRDLDELLPTITEFIREQFDLYYSHVYFVDDVRENLVIKAGTGMVGQELLARRFSLPIGPGSIVGRVAAEAKSIVVPDTETSDIHKPNPLLPDTRSELAVPLIVGEQVVGVLDMQSDRVNTFTEDNLIVFEAMATQLAISIDSAQQWALSQEARQKSEEAIRQLTRETWAEKLRTKRRDFAYAYDLAAVTPISRTDQATDSNGLSAPLIVQNQPIGQLMIETPPDYTWSEDEKDLLSAVAQQLAQKAENLRLFEETQQRATREQITRQITDKVRASRDIETALKTATEELSKALGITKAVVELRMAPENEQTNETTDQGSGHSLNE
jgi:GAF domain-containing protein/HAMP domain-containing protein